MSITKEQGKKIQILRGWAILAVVAAHVLFGSPYELYINGWVNFCVGCFLFLSGFFIGEEHMTSLKGFYQKRMLRILIPYTFWSVVYTLYDRNFDRVIFRFLTGQCCSVYYYLFVYFQLLILAPLLIKMMKTRLWWLPLVITPLAIAVEYYLALKTEYLLIYPWNINNFAVWVLYFYAGILVHAHPVTNDIKKIPYGLLLLGLILTYVFCVWENGAWLSFGRQDISTTSVKFSVIFWTGAILLMFFRYMKDEEKTVGIIGSILKYVGDASFGVYLIHQLVLSFLGRRNLLQPHALVNYVVVMAASVALVLGVRVAVLAVSQNIGKKVLQWIGFI